MAIKEDILFILSRYLDGQQNSITRKEVNEKFKELVQKFEQLPIILNQSKIKIVYGMGIGRVANVPHIEFLDGRETDTPLRGIYVNYLFKADMSGIYLTFHQGTQSNVESRPNKTRLYEIHLNAWKIRKEYPWLAEKGFQLDDNIYLADTGESGERYEKATIAYKYYEKNQLPSDSELEKDLKIMLDAYELYILNKSEKDNLEDIQRSKKVWLFQANPKFYDLRSAVRHLEELNWKVSSFKDEIHLGDRVYFWESGPNAGIVAIGEVIFEPSELQKDENELPFIKDAKIDNDTNPRARVKISNVLDIPLSKNQIVKNPILNNMQILRSPMGSNFRVTDDEDIEIQKLLKIDRPKVAMTYSIEDFINDTGFEKMIIESWQRRLSRKKHIIFQGPPGTGKTFVAQRLAKLTISDTEGFYELVQFHPSYAYEDFIQGIRPSLSNGGQLSYDLKDGQFIEFCKKAEKVSNSPCVLIIDEINRANLSRVFGELMYLLEYRDNEIPLSGGTNFKIPENVFIIGTMNTADRSIAVVDHALRRRFSFIRLNPEYDVLKNYLISKGYPGESLVKVLAEINMAIDDPNYEIGISYFMKKDDDLRVSLPEIWESEIESYLEEYFYDKPAKVDSFRWDTLSESKLSDWLSTIKSGN